MRTASFIEMIPSPSGSETELLTPEAAETWGIAAGEAMAALPTAMMLAARNAGNLLSFFMLSESFCKYYMQKLTNQLPYLYYIIY